MNLAKEIRHVPNQKRSCQATSFIVLRSEFQFFWFCIPMRIFQYLPTKGKGILNKNVFVIWLRVLLPATYGGRPIYTLNYRIWCIHLVLIPYSCENPDALIWTIKANSGYKWNGKKATCFSKQRIINMMISTKSTISKWGDVMSNLVWWSTAKNLSKLWPQ